MHPDEITVTVQYFSELREQRGAASESLATAARNPRELYAELRRRYGFHWEPGPLKVALNDEFAGWDDPLRGGDTVVFLAPVAGG